MSDTKESRLWLAVLFIACLVLAVAMSRDRPMQAAEKVMPPCAGR